MKENIKFSLSFNKKIFDKNGNISKNLKYLGCHWDCEYEFNLIKTNKYIFQEIQNIKEKLADANFRENFKKAVQATFKFKGSKKNQKVKQYIGLTAGILNQILA